MCVRENARARAFTYVSIVYLRIRKCVHRVRHTMYNSTPGVCATLLNDIIIENVQYIYNNFNNVYKYHYEVSGDEYTVHSTY